MERYQQLLAALDECIAVLRSHSEERWAAWFEADRARLAERDSSALGHLLSAYGGMGSINDLLFPTDELGADGSSHIYAVDKRLSSLLTEIYTIAYGFKRELDADA